MEAREDLRRIDWEGVVGRKEKGNRNVTEGRCEVEKEWKQGKRMI